MTWSHNSDVMHQNRLISQSYLGACVSLQVADLLVAMCRAALQSPRKNIIFEPYPSIVDPLNPQTLAFSPKVSPRLISSTKHVPRDLLFSLWSVDAVWQVQNYERLQQTLDSILLIKTTGQVSFCVIYSQINGSFKLLWMVEVDYSFIYLLTFRALPLKSRSRWTKKIPWLIPY